MTFSVDNYSIKGQKAPQRIKRFIQLCSPQVVYASCKVTVCGNKQTRVYVLERSNHSVFTLYVCVGLYLIQMLDRSINIPSRFLITIHCSKTVIRAFTKWQHTASLHGQLCNKLDLHDIHLTSTMYCQNLPVMDFTFCSRLRHL